VRPAARGKFLYAGSEKLWVRGVTYGAFRPDADRREYQDLKIIECDFRQIAAAGFNAVRIPHTMPPRELLDCAQRNGLRVMAGLSAEQYAGFLADGKNVSEIETRITSKVDVCRGHPALLCYALGNEIPASMVRWLGRKKVERYLERLYSVVKSADPAGLITYVNYPSTEYLDLPFLDLVSFNVYLESRERLEAYLARLQNIAGDRPLLMSELGLDSLRNGTDKQAETLGWQIRSTFAAGGCGAFVFSWTDEWYRGGADVDDWAFGLTDRERRPKPALAAVRSAFSDAPFPADQQWPRISVVVCIYNGESTVRDCCEGLRALDYPDYEVIIVDDGSTDRTAAIASEFGFRLIRTENCGLSRARNTGLQAATGEVVAYTDGDARPDRDWLRYLAWSFMTTTHAGIGGWNIAPAGDGWIADCVANSPGGPMHVLLSDALAEHIPGCNMAFRRAALESIGGFDPQFRAAGDDVDVCWRLQDRGETLGFSAGGMVWHHYRDSLGAYWKQQTGYGKAEAMLERKWPEKYNAAGHVPWKGRLYGRGLTLPLARRGRIYHGIWGLAPFQTAAEPPAGVLRALPLMPEWYLLALLSGFVAVLGLEWHSLRLAAVPFVLSIIVPVAQAVVSSRRSWFSGRRSTSGPRLRAQFTVACLHLLQPLARLRGRLNHGLTMWRRRDAGGTSFPVARTFPLWVGRWQEPHERLHHLRTLMKSDGAVVLSGGDYDGWDLEVRGGILGGARLLMAVEDTGSGTQLVRIRCWPQCYMSGWVMLVISLSASLVAGITSSYGPAAVFGAIAAGVAWRIVHECGTTTGTILRGMRTSGLAPARKAATVLQPNQEQV
jgi:glycosyltransferase involved in cell wall biosynthesis